MATQLQTENKVPMSRAFTPMPSRLLQRKCACGNHSMAGGECAECAKKKGMLQRKLTIGASNDPLEQEANRVADEIMSMPLNSKVNPTPPRIQRFSGQATNECLETAPPSVDRVLNSLGTPLEPSLRQDMEARFGHDFSQVRVYTDSAAEQSTRDMDANAYTVGKNVVFGSGQFSPETYKGRRLLAHELGHVVQQASTSQSSLVQRDLKAYNLVKSESMFMADFSGGGSSSSVSMSAEAPDLRVALSDLMTADKVKEVKSSDGSVSWFAAQHHKNVQLDEIRVALVSAGYANADRLARTIYDIHGEFLYSNQSLTTSGAFYSHTSQLGKKIETVHNRSMTEWEIRQARLVFGNAINYSKVTIADGSISSKLASVRGYARTVGNVINFPTGRSRNMSFMVHELTHVWQYQTNGWSYASSAIWAQITEGYSYADEGKTNEQSLLDAREAGKTLGSYNKEQQGDIASDYYIRLQQKKDVSAWQPFINDIK